MELFAERSGADAQAEAVFAYLSAKGGIENSWSDALKKYVARPSVARWHNCREQGFVVSLSSANYSRQINIAFFEHRNSDEICAVEWEQRTFNPPTIDTAKFGNVYRDKFDVSHSVSYGRPAEMADWIMARLTAFWAETSALAA